MDKEFEVQKIYVHKRSPYARVLLKCTTAVWGSGPSYVFSMLYSTGTTIPEEIVIDKPDKAMPCSIWLLVKNHTIQDSTYSSLASQTLSGEERVW